MAEVQAASSSANPAAAGSHAAPKVSTRAKLIILTAVMASLLEIIDTSIVNVAVPTMMGNLGSTLDEISWVVTGYIIANAIVLPIASWMSQQIGRKFYYTACVLLFTAASVACGMAPNLPVLVIFRVIQGFAGGALLPTSQALIYEAFPKEMAGMASAIYGMSVMVGPTVGPTLGGYLTDHLGWRSIFNINLPLGLICAVLSYLFVEEIGFDPNREIKRKKAAATGGEPLPVTAEALPKAKRRGLLKPKDQRTPVDSWGLTFLVVGIGCLQYVMERGHADDWFDSKAIVICSILAVSSLISLIWWELRTEHPILQLRHFKNPSFRSGILLMSALGAMLYGLIFVLPVFVSSMLGFTAQQTGELFIPGALASAAIMPFMGAQLRKGRDPRQLIIIGICLLAYAGLAIGRFDTDSSTSSMFWPLLIRGAAMAFLFVPINTTVLMQFSGAAIGEAAGLLNLCRQLGGSVSIALLSTLLAQFQDRAFLNLSSHITFLDPIAYQQLHSMMSIPHSRLPEWVGMGTPMLAATKIFYGKVKRQAFVLAFQKTLFIVVMMFSLALIPLRSMRPGKKLAAGEKLPDAH
jgi:DHA2 family multidrug resistance protein